MTRLLAPLPGDNSYALRLPRQNSARRPHHARPHHRGAGSGLVPPLHGRLQLRPLLPAQADACGRRSAWPRQRAYRNALRRHGRCLLRSKPHDAQRQVSRLQAALAIRKRAASSPPNSNSPASTALSSAARPMRPFTCGFTTARPNCATPPTSGAWVRGTPKRACARSWRTTRWRLPAAARQARSSSSLPPS